jgi:hypothetical protein
MSFKQTLKIENWWKQQTHSNIYLPFFSALTIFIMLGGVFANITRLEIKFPLSLGLGKFYYFFTNTPPKHDISVYIIDMYFDIIIAH